jgi:hypothetical protein
MNVFSVITMMIVLGVVWGGLLYFLIKAIKYEKLKGLNDKE